MGYAAREHEEHLHIELLPGMDAAFADVDEVLGVQAKMDFRDELVHAFMESVRTGSDRPMNETIHAWYRTLLFKRSGVDARLADLPDEDISEAMDLEDVREFLKL